MNELRLHGRGGQGVVLASEILAHALYLEGKEAQAFPLFGAERRGAPVTAFVRFDEEPISARTEVRNPDHVLVMAPALIKMKVDFCAGLKPKGVLLINYAGTDRELSAYRDYTVFAVDATAIAVRYKLGAKTAPIVNCVMLGAFQGATGLVSMESLAKAIPLRLSTRPEENIKAAADAAREVRRVAWELNT